ncbi:hypothetical protein [Mycobacterium sp.]|uniref:hypothetical protein n=1 Tax=Mycobacterium sp. TaxID=1785 RepID=UPI0025D61C7E|nr:hypothetical protein [Mycobacterium sp.]
MGASRLQDADLDGVAEFVDAARTLVLGAVAASAPPRHPAPEEVVGAVGVIDRLGFALSALRNRIGRNPPSGLANGTPEWTRNTVALARKVAENPEAI